MIRIIVNLSFEGVHSWPDCPIQSVSFLRNPHRHIFHVTAKKKVSHTDREIEIIELKRKIEDYCDTTFYDAGSKSCEDMAIELAEVFELDYCSVLEDNENGAEYIKEK